MEIIPTNDRRKIGAQCRSSLSPPILRSFPVRLAYVNQPNAIFLRVVYYYQQQYKPNR